MSPRPLARKVSGRVATIGMGEKNLATLLKSMQPVFLEGNWSFVTVPNGKPMPPGLNPMATFREPEGMSLLLDDADVAKSGLVAAFHCKGISLNVNSSLYAIGFLAAISEVLARQAMSINIISAFNRDYLFVPVARADEALQTLKKLARNA
ncbi:MAG: hypothetical protein DI536_08380 [Archangium gephyra]|uniref:Uncharacterized protein n=1 Tax=Archangium gephyra TaxID=48 RepID=A0A2W5TSG7_9BACT|nr:MAG: hypothetical protein DI536_08380 [Archangium gephyra]